MGQCIFCGAVGKLTKEHIWADWLKKYIPKDRPNYTAHSQTVWQDGRKTDRKKRLVGGDVRSMRVKCVCNSKTHAKSTPNREGCNDGWMCKLQEAAKPIVIPLIDGKSIALTAKSQQILSGWIAMSIMCGEFHCDETQTIPQSHRTRLYNAKRPPKDYWKIWIGDYDRQEWVPHKARFVLSITEEETTETAHLVSPPSNTQVTTYTIGRLYVHCISSIWKAPVERFNFPTPGDGRFLRQIWPILYSPIAWPPKLRLTDKDADRIASEFMRRATGVQ